MGMDKLFPVPFSPTFTSIEVSFELIIRRPFLELHFNESASRSLVSSDKYF